MALLTSVLMMPTSPITAAAQTYDEQSYLAQQTSDDLRELGKYLLNLGSYLGYNLKQAMPTPYSNLLSMDSIQLNQRYLLTTLLGAIPVNSVSATLSIFVPTTMSQYQALNAFTNYSFKTQPYNTPTTENQGKISVSNLIDQQTYQTDPVSQSILNILATPNYTYCMSHSGTQWDKTCKLLYNQQVSNNVVGELPKPQEYFSYSYNQALLPELNSNALLGPLVYSTQTAAPTGSTTDQNSQKKGLAAQNQAQAAANFIRYAAYLVEPIALPTQQNYSSLYNQATNLSGKTSVADQKKAQSALSKYLNSLRIYAAQSSVSFSNLYYILSKRMPQDQGSTHTSQAMSEFVMATWRIYNPGHPNDKQWLNEINHASTATVQKEIAALLSEINYQLYLTRQQQERLLLTESILLLQNARSGKPYGEITSTQTAQ